MVRDLKRKKKKIEIVLASASPRRRDLLKPFFKLKILPADINESRHKGESPRTYVCRMAQEKWQKVAREIKNQAPRIIVASDTSVVLKKKIFGKALNQKHAQSILKQLSGREHEVMSAVCVGWCSRKPRLKLVITKVHFRNLTEVEIRDYILSGEWKGKAGAYAIQGEALSFASSLVGSLTGVIGLPLNQTLGLIEHFFSHPPA